MPHKHKRKRGDDDSHYELPPTEKARPLSTSKGALFTEDADRKRGAKRKRPRKDDDTPAAFKRLMDLKNGIRPRSGLDDGSSKPGRKSQKPSVASKPAQQFKAPTNVAPKIKPGERMNDFSARVDAALPVIGLAKKNRGEKNEEGIRRPQTKAQRRQQNMQKEWREIDARWKEKVAEAKEEAEEEYEEVWRAFDDGSSKKKRKKGKAGGVDDHDDEDPWAVVGKAREAPSTKLVGLHDVVQDIPRFTVAPKEKMRIKNGAVVDVDNIPQASGSLKRREELSNSRRKIIDAYRDLTKGKLRI